ncbi:MAG: flagellar biosynthetic protein FliR [Acidobacteria bacterium]|nr:flagellar biosynthetic protein FliR [Acidobacteriota bacterium]
MDQWTAFLSAMLLTLIRVSGIVVFAPFLSSSALPIRVKAVFTAAVTFLLAPIVGASPAGQARIALAPVMGELAVGLVYGLMLALLNETLLFAGEIIGLQFSFSAVNLLDPTSSIQTPLMNDLFQMMGTLVVIAAGLDRILLASLMRSFRAVPLGTYALWPGTSWSIVQAAGGVFLAAVELAAPVLAATMLAEIAVALLSRLSPQLPVMSLTVPLKTCVGLGVLVGSLALWPRFIEARFSILLNLAERLLQSTPSGTAMGFKG